MDIEKIGAFIASLRKEKNLTQNDLAKKLNITTQAVSKWERGKGCPDISILEDLANILEVQVLEILKGERIGKREKIGNKDVIESMSYAENIVKEKYKIVNAILVMIILIPFILVVFFNACSLYSINKKYYGNIEVIINYDKDAISKFDIEKRIDLILNNKGIYNESEYQAITYYVSKVKENYNPKEDLEKFKRAYYKYNDIFNYVYSNFYDYLSESIIYEYLIKHNPLKQENYDEYTNIKTQAAQEETVLYEFIENNSFYNNDIIKHIVDTYTSNPGFAMSSTAYLKYKALDLILNDIIEVGEIHE